MASSNWDYFMKKILNVILRFVVRIWHMHRNQLLTQAFNIIEKELEKRKEILIHTPKNRRDELIQNDYILKHCVGIYKSVYSCLEGTKRAK